MGEGRIQEEAVAAEAFEPPTPSLEAVVVVVVVVQPPLVSPQHAVVVVC